MNAAPLAAANRRFRRSTRSSIGAAPAALDHDEQRQQDRAATSPTITTGSSQPLMPPRETPSTRPVSPATKVAVPSRSRPRFASRLGELVEHARAPERPGERERDVEPEHPLPGDRDQRAAEHRAEDEADGGDHRVGPHRQAELLARERVGDERGRVGEQERAADPLQDPPQQQLGAAAREAGAERGEREDSEAAARRRACARTGRTAALPSAPARSRRSCRRGSPTRARGCRCGASARDRGGR